MNRLRQILHGPTGRWLGGLVSAACLLVFLFLLQKAFFSPEGQQLIANHWPSMLLALCLYGIAYVPMVGAWIVLAQACGCRPARRELAFVFLISQAAKYLPGNVGQFIGRALAGQSRNFPLAALGRAMALELGSTLAASALLAFAALGFGVANNWPATATTWIPAVSLALVLCAALAGSAVVFLNRETQRAVLRPCVAAVACYLIVLALVAAANVLLVAVNIGEWNWGLVLSVGSAFLVSWLAGFITPGAPAGLGVRELTFCTLLAGTVASETLLISAAAFRAVTTSGDFIAWGVGLAIRPALRAQSAVTAAA